MAASSVCIMRLTLPKTGWTSFTTARPQKTQTMMPPRAQDRTWTTSRLPLHLLPVPLSHYSRQNFRPRRHPCTRHRPPSAPVDAAVDDGDDGADIYDLLEVDPAAFAEELAADEASPSACAKSAPIPEGILDASRAPPGEVFEFCTDPLQFPTNLDIKSIPFWGRRFLSPLGRCKPSVAAVGC